MDNSKMVRDTDLLDRQIKMGVAIKENGKMADQLDYYENCL